VGQSKFNLHQTHRTCRPVKFQSHFISRFYIFYPSEPLLAGWLKGVPMNKKEKQITLKVDLNIKTYRFDTGAKKTWIIPLLILAIKIISFYLKMHGS
jgi:hypothetical protein